MSFNCCEFKFDGVSCTQYDLEVYSFGSGSNSNGKFFTGADIVENRLKSSSFPLHYGVTRNEAMTIEFTFGVNQDRIDSKESLTRQEMRDIATWLTEHDEYKYLEIVQDDMAGIRYKCFITGLEYVTYDGEVWGFEAKATCDSPYAYTLPETTTVATISGSGSASVSFASKASPTYYKPKIIITSTSSTASNTITIVNANDSNRQFQITGIPAGSVTITVDNENEIITNNQSLNLYGNLTSYRFFRLVRGANNLTITGEDVTVKFECEFPVNVGN